MLGRRFLRLEHRGRKSGTARRAVLEVVDEIQRNPVVVSGFGESSDWFKNVRADPRVGVVWGRESFPANARRLGEEEAIAVLERYRIAHPRAAEVLGDRLGVSLVDDLRTTVRTLPVLVLERA